MVILELSNKKQELKDIYNEIETLKILLLKNY